MTPSSTPPLNSSDFENLLNALAQDIQDASIFRNLNRDLRAAWDEYSREFNQSNTFWSLCIHALIETVVGRLSRVYVSNKTALSLERWLQAIKDSPQLFDTPPDPVQLAADLEVVGANDPLVKKLVAFRGNFIAHVNWENTLEGGKKIGDRFHLKSEEIDQLVSRALTILNRYSILFKKTSWSSIIVGDQDFLTILKAIRADLERRDAEIAAEVRALSVTARTGEGGTTPRSY